MKYISEYRDAPSVKAFAKKIHALVSRPWTLMEVCGGQTHSLIRNGILELLPKQVNIVHGPGCPVCVTPQSIIDAAVALADRPNTILCSFGDMLRVPGSRLSLLEAKSKGADVRILYSPLEAVQLARQHPTKEVVFFGVGFETTAPANALSVLHAERQGIPNYALLAAHVLVPPAMVCIMEDPATQVDGFLAAGHVCAIMGTRDYEPLVAQYQVPIVVTGFEPLDLMEGIYLTLLQLEQGAPRLENQYRRVVADEGNLHAQAIIHQVFEPCDKTWRGIGRIAQSGYNIREAYASYDALVKFSLSLQEQEDDKGCLAGDILKGIKKPKDCPHFGENCSPLHPLGAPMVSSEGACAAYFQFTQHEL